MNDQTKTGLSVWQRSNIIRAFRWLLSWRGIRRVLIVLAWTVTIVGLFYGEENWRGRRAWNQYREATEAHGVSLDYATYIPKPVPDEQNFAATPFFKSFLLTDNSSILTNDLWSRANNHITTTNTEKDKGRRHFTDLVAWQAASTALQSGPLNREQKFETDETGLAARAAAAPVILEGMKPDAAAFAELRAASAREFSRYPVVYDLENPCDTKVPHLYVKGVCQRLGLQACAELAAGQSDAALADVKLVLSLADSIKSEPFLISFLVRVACVQIAIQSVWEGLAEHRWTDAQLQELQSRFSAFDFLGDLQPTLKAERASRLVMVDLARKMGLGSFSEMAEVEGAEDAGMPDDKLPLYVLGWVIPSGWYDQEKLNYSTLFDARTDGVVDLAAKTVSPRKDASNFMELAGQTYGRYAGKDLQAILHHRLIAAMLLGSSGSPIPAARAQTTADQAALACALERYRLANGQFPETLEALTPRFISRAPNDVITGQPFKYRRAADGQFVLYSVGWNEKDDGGVPGKDLFDQTQGDWVWSYPAQ